MSGDESTAGLVLRNDERLRRLEEGMVRLARGLANIVYARTREGRLDQRGRLAQGLRQILRENGEAIDWMGDVVEEWGRWLEGGV